MVTVLGVPDTTPQVICAIGNGHSADTVLNDIPAANCSRDLEVDAVYIRAYSSVEGDVSGVLQIEPIASDEVLCSASGRDGLITKDGIAEQLEGAAGNTAAECDIAFTKAQYDITRCCLIEKQSGSVVDLVAGIAERVTCHSCGYFQGAVVDREDARIGSFSVNNQGAYTVFGQTAGVRTIECGAPGDVLAIGVHTDRAGAVEDTGTVVLGDAGAVLQGAASEADVTAVAEGARGSCYVRHISHQSACVDVSDTRVGVGAGEGQCAAAGHVDIVISVGGSVVADDAAQGLNRRSWRR